MSRHEIILERIRVERGWEARTLLDAVERWGCSAGEGVMLREMMVDGDDGGRLDAVIVPTSWNNEVMKRSGRKYGLTRTHWTDRFGLVGIEVKATKQDFERGLEEGQFHRYRDLVSGLFIVTTPIVKSQMVPEGIGHLVVYEPGTNRRGLIGTHCVCKRHPTYERRELDHELAVRLLWRMAQNARDRERSITKETERIGEKAGKAVARAVMNLRGAGLEGRMQP